MSFFVYIIFRILIAIFKLFPFWLLYRISDFWALLLKYVIRYRYKVILNNLISSFPEMSKTEIKRLILPIYRNITDILVETIKGYSLKPSTVLKRMVVTNIDLLNELYEKHNGVIGVLGHYGNWEWAGLLAGLTLKCKTVALYKPLSNKYLDSFIKNNRSRFGIELSPIYITANTFDRYLNKKVFYALIADQSPSNINKAIWVKFLNKDTACLHGPEKYAKMYNMPIVYVHINRVKRGYYNVTFELLKDKNAYNENGKITEWFMQTLEKDIIKSPEQWLWSHRRWKHKKN
jgi:KDO2-lipid IV(A) lauroyltransferase